MKKNKITKASKTRLIVFGTICVFIISYFVINSVSMLLNIKNLTIEQETLENDLLKLQEKESNLTNELSKLKNDEYKARYAREYFLYSKENGEYIFTTILDEEDEIIVDESEKEDNSLYNYVIAGFIIILLFVVLIILKRVRNGKNRD